MPERGDGHFTVAPGGGDRIGTGTRVVRFQVMVEGGAGVDPAAFAAFVERTLADPRSWIASGRYTFQRVSSGPTNLYVHLATPGTTDTECGRRYVRTKGEVSCRGGDDVFINLKRWQLAIPAYAGNVDGYRHYVVNHEIGHFLGNGHVRCPVPGGPAPVMQTQSLDMTGCGPNAWPYPDGHRLFTGPTAAS